MLNPLNINVKRCLKVSSFGTLGLILLLLILLFTGALLAAFPLTGIGEYVVAAEKIEGKEFKLIPELKGESTTVGFIQLKEAKIDDLFLSKNVNLSGVLKTYGVSDIDIIVAIKKKINGTDLLMYVTGIDARETGFLDLGVVESKNDYFKTGVELDTVELLLNDAKLYTHHLAAKEIYINPLGLRIHVHQNE
mgnify:FL=1